MHSVVSLGEDGGCTHLMWVDGHEDLPIPGACLPPNPHSAKHFVFGLDSDCSRALSVASFNPWQMMICGSLTTRHALISWHLLLMLFIHKYRLQVHELNSCVVILRKKSEVRESYRNMLYGLERR